MAATPTTPATPAPLDALFDVGHASLAGTIAAVATGNRRDALLTTSQIDAYRKHVQPGTTGTRLWTDPTVGTYVVLDD